MFLTTWSGINFEDYNNLFSPLIMSLLQFLQLVILVTVPELSYTQEISHVKQGIMFLQMDCWNKLSFYQFFWQKAQIHPPHLSNLSFWTSADLTLKWSKIKPDQFFVLFCVEGKNNKFIKCKGWIWLWHLLINGTLGLVIYRPITATSVRYCFKSYSEA